MGCDIHCFAEYKIKGKWHFAREVEIDRNYELFGRMAECGRSIDTVPIKPNAGIPEDADFMTRYMMEHSADHSFSFLTSEEVIQLHAEFPEFRERQDSHSVWFSWRRQPDSMYKIDDWRWIFGFDN